MGAFKTKHKGDIQQFTPTAITEFIKSSGEAFQKLQTEREAMKQVELTKRTCAELLGRMVIEEQFITTTQLNIIAKEMECPTHDYGAPGSVWEFYNHTTFAMKGIHPTLWMNNHMGAHSFFVNETGLYTPTVNVEETEYQQPEDTPLGFLQLAMSF
jgi:hypothetical protein